MTYETILYDVADGVATVTLNRPEVHNAMNDRMRQELTRCFGEVATSDAVRVVVVTGAGERAFSAGADIREFVEPQVPVRFRESRRRVDFRAAMDRCPQPIVAAIRGYALGGGLELALARALAEKAPVALRYAKEAVVKGLELPLADGLRLENDLATLLRTTADRVEGAKAFLEKRKPRFSGT